MTPAERRARGIAARALSNDPTLAEGWNIIEQELRSQWENCWLPRKRDRIWNELRHLRALRQKLTSFAADAPRD
ncbi:MAG: hypothetical protein ACK4S3_02625 [Parvibaculum sp.]